MAILGKNVLLVDLDPQGHLTSFLGIETHEVNKTIYDVLREEVEPQQSFIKKQLGARLNINGQDSRLFVTVIPANLDFAEAEVVLSRWPNPETLLRNAISKISDEFDYILIDCPPSLGLLATNALVAAKKVFVPVQTEYLALESLDNLRMKMDAVATQWNPDLEIGGLIATRYDGRKVLNRTVVERLREQFGALLLETMIRENIVLAEAPSFGKDIFTYRPRSYGTEDYLNLCLEILGEATTSDGQFTVERGGVISKRPSSHVAY